MVPEKDNRCNKFVFQAFNNLKDGSQDFTKVMISSPKIETAFINSGSGSQNFNGLKIQCEDESIRKKFELVALFGMDKLFNYDENGSQTFPDFTFLEYLRQTLANKKGERKIETQIALLKKLLSSMAYGSNDKRGATSSNNSTKHDNHTGNNRHRTVSTPSVTTTTTTISRTNSPRPTPNHLLLSGIVQSFNNSKEGKQDFSRAKVKSTAIRVSFNNLGSGSQTFIEADIRCGEESTKPSTSTFFKLDHVAHNGNPHSFNNKGSQSFYRFKFN
ncbi:hypothetical protein VNO80_10694 [Phaseolus coccineus]|uniref:Uncharacterized protein n=1 Tax=Phaseolus coccineus TaxID=3886 RepID=A0AAN9RAP2_PHACN